MTNLITHIEQVTTGWLTAVLRASGALAGGDVSGFAVNAGSGNWSDNARLQLQYTPDAQGERPSPLFLKMVNTDLGDGEYFGSSEVAYYTKDYQDVHNAPLLRCYDACYSASAQRYHLLLDDVYSTHVPAYEKGLDLEYGLALAEGLAILHARWWGAQRLAEVGAPIHDAAFIQRFVQIAAPGVDHIIAGLSTELEPHWPALLRDLFARHPRALMARTADDKGFTLIHGDVGEANVMVPRQGSRPLYIIDRQPFDWCLTTWLGTYDLVYAMILDWPVETRRRLAEPVLRHYHQSLQANGVRDYSWAELRNDYRLMIPLAVYIAVEYCRGGFNAERQQYWLPMLRRALTACTDYRCQEFWPV